MACNALPSSSLSAMSSFRQQQTSPTEATHSIPSTADRAREAKCPDCKNLFKLFTEGARGWNTKPHRVCLACYRSRRHNRHSRQTLEQQPTTQATLATDPISQIAAFQTTVLPRKRRHHFSPFRDLAVSLAKNAPSIDILERFAAESLRLTGERSSRQKPQARNSSSDYRSDCAPVSAIAEMSMSSC